MEPLDPRPIGEALPPPSAATAASAQPGAADRPPRVGSQAGPDLDVSVMAPWRVAGAVALSGAFVLMGWQVQRVVDDRAWSDPLMWASIACMVAAAMSVLGWTWATVANARRLVEPAITRELPDPKRAVVMWLVPFAFVAAAVALVAYLAVQANTGPDDTVSSVPLAVAVLALLIAIPTTYRPLHYLAGVVRQVGGHSSNLSQWMWVPVVLAIVGIGSIVALRLGGVVSDEDGAVTDASQWAPLWVVGVVAIVPCVVVVVLAWRAAVSVEEAVVLAADRRGRLTGPARRQVLSNRRVSAARLDAAAYATRRRVRLIPGSDLLRLCIVTLLAGLALLTMVGSAIAVLFWSESTDGVLLPSQRVRAWDALEVLQTAARVVAFGLIALVTIWTFVSVFNVRMASARRRNPIIAAVAWPAAAFGLWTVADRLVVDQSTGMIVLGFAVQAAILYVPFYLLQRSADAVDARRTPIGITYIIGVVLLVYVQALGSLSTIQESADANFGRLAVFLGIGALIQLLSTLAVTEACRTLDVAIAREADAVNALVDQRDAVAQRTADIDAFSATPAPMFTTTTVMGPQ
jgi:hypothetical protein